ncbi:MAG: hypothetical protein R3D53_14150 [Paracoccaceae bacterium]
MTKPHSNLIAVGNGARGETATMPQPLTCPTRSALCWRRGGDVAQRAAAAAAEALAAGTRPVRSRAPTFWTAWQR